MATTTKSKSSAKPKTTKRPAKAAAAKAPTKVTKKTVSKKVTTKTTKAAVKPAVKTTKVTNTARTLTNATLRRWHLLSAAVFVILAVVTILVAKVSTYDFTLSHATRDDLASGSETVFASAAHVMTTIDLRWILVVILGVSAVISLLRATRLKAKEQKAVSTHVSPVRWIDFGVTFGALVATTLLISGIHDAGFLKLVGFTVIVGYFFSWLAESEAATTNIRTKLFYAASIVAAVVPWLIYACAAIGTEVYGEVRYSWFAYAAAATAFIGVVLVANNQKRALRGAIAYIKAERNYVVLNLLTKAVFAAVLILGLR